MSIIIKTLLFLILTIVLKVQLIYAYVDYKANPPQVMCAPGKYFCYGPHTIAKCNSDGDGYSGKQTCSYGLSCISGKCSQGTNNDVAPVSNASFIAYAGGIAGCWYDNRWIPNGSCATLDGVTGKCITDESQNLAYLYPDNDCCGDKVATKYGKCVYGCIAQISGRTYYSGDTTDWYECGVTSPNKCWGRITGDVDAFKNPYCHFNTTSNTYCECQSDGTWERKGSGCHPVDTIGSGNYDFQCASGWTNTKPSGAVTETAEAWCETCNNNPSKCYKCYLAVENGDCHPTGARCDPPTNLCDGGTGSWLDDTGSDGRFNWECNGIDGRNSSCETVTASNLSCSSIHIPNADAVCGSNNGQDIPSSPVPTTDLCSVGTTTAITSTTDTFSWGCTGICDGADTTCSATRNYKPKITGVLIKNNINTIVTAEDASGRNHICQTAFHNSRDIIFEVTINDVDGVADVNDANITLTWNNHTIPRISVASTDATHKVATFELDFPSSYNSTTTYPLIATVTDSKSQTDTDSSRNFKVWDCNVDITTSDIYDGTKSVTGSPVCSDINSFSTKIGPESNFQNPLTISPLSGTGDPKTMSVTPPSTFNSGDSLLWGLKYPLAGFTFNPGIKISTVGIIMKLNKSTCYSEINLTDNLQVDPYSQNPSLSADLSSMVNQDPWWQTVDGGAFGNLLVEDRIPSTCTTADCVISIGALVAAPTINNTGKSPYQNWSYGGQLAETGNDYKYFYDQYYVKNKIGTLINSSKTITSVNDLGSDLNNVYFINGDLTINGDILLGAKKFLLIAVSGDIKINSTTKQVDGVLVAKNISADGESTEKLNINGSVYVADKATFTRKYPIAIDKVSDNNTQPAVSINFNPELLFNIPGAVAKVLSNWQWGN